MYVLMITTICISIFISIIALIISFKTSHPVIKYIAWFVGLAFLVLAIYLILMVSGVVSAITIS